MGSLRAFACGACLVGAVGTSYGQTTAEVSAVKTGPKTFVDLTYISPFLGQQDNKVDGGVFEPFLQVDWPIGVFFNVWGQFQTADNGGETNDGEFSEVDFTIGYNIPLPDPKFKLAVSLSEYMYPGTGNEKNDEESDREALAVLSSSLPLNPMLKVYYRLNGAKANEINTETRLTQEVYSQGDFAASMRGSLGYVQRTASYEKESGLASGASYTRLSAIAKYSMITTSINYLFETDRKVSPMDEQQNIYFTVGSSAVL